MINEYKISSLFAPIMSSTSHFSFPLFILYKGTIVKVLSSSNNWFYIEYNEKYGYIKKNLIEKINNMPGKVTINYINSTSELPLSDTIYYTNLEYGTYNYTAKIINGYTVLGDKSKTITLTKDNPEQIITFYYTEILGNISICYLDSITNSYLLDLNNITNLSLGNYSYNAIHIDGYDIIGDSIKSVTLTEDNPNINIIFYYTKIKIELPSDLSMNDVPYISTYYIEPIVKPNEEVFIDFYITDYYQKEYQKEDFSEKFDVTLKVEGRKDRIYTNLSAGDNTISLGSFSNEGEVNFSIFCTDKYGRSSHELFNFFLVRNAPQIKEYIMTEEDLITYNIKNNDSYEILKYIDIGNVTVNTTTDVTPVLNLLQQEASNIIVPSKSYICIIPTKPANKSDSPQSPGDYWYKQCLVKYSNDYDKDTVMLESRNTKNGLQKFINDKKLEGFNAIKLLTGIYRITGYNENFSDSDPILIPSGLTLDLNNSTIKLNQFTGCKASLFELYNTFDTHLINGIIEGDYYTHDYTNSTNNSEWVNGVGLKSGTRYSSIENLTIKNITGYAVYHTIGNPKINGLNNEYGQNKISIEKLKETGDIDTNTGLPINCNTRVRTNDFIDISDWISTNYICYMSYLSYGGVFNNTWNCMYYFYDINKNYIKSITGYHYRMIKIPSNSKYMKLVSYNSTLLLNCIIYFNHPINCWYNNITFKNIRCVGIAPQDMNNFIIKNCNFIKTGQTSARCAIDLEDGWERMQDCTLKNLHFENCPTTDIIVFAGENIIIDNIDGNLTLGSRVHSYTIKNSTSLKRTTLGYTDIYHTGYPRINNFSCDGGVNITVGSTSILKLRNCSIKGSTNGGKNTEYINCDISQTSLYDKNDYRNTLGSAIYRNCYIHDKDTSTEYYFTRFVTPEYYECKLENFNTVIGGKTLFSNCILNNYNGKFNPQSQNYDGRGICDCTTTISNSIINNSTFTILDTNYGANITIFNCTINITNTLLSLPHYSLKFPILIEKNIIVSTNNKGLIYFSNDDTSKLSGGNNIDSISLNYNTITLNNSSYIIYGLSKTTKNKISVITLNNTLSPSTLSIFDLTLLDNPNITLTH